MPTPTPHNAAQKDQIAKTVLMPGDPQRARFIAEIFLDDAELVSDIRDICAYTGTYGGKPVTVMASGMGMPSIGIYSYELYKFYDVDRIIRIGTTGSYLPDLKLYDTVLATSAWSDSSFARVQSGDTDEIQLPSAELNDELRASAERQGIRLYEGRLHSSDVYYADTDDYVSGAMDRGCCCVEMESFALFHHARHLGKQAACLLTVSNSFVDNAETTPEERRTAFQDMMKVALGVL